MGTRTDRAPRLAERKMLQHAAECQGCGELLWIHLRLTAAEPDIPMPSQTQFAEMRREVLRCLTPLAPPAAKPLGQSTQRSFPSLLSNLFLNPLFAYALLILMVFSTAIYSGGGSSAPTSWSSLLESEIGRQATASAILQESSDSPYILSNLSIRSLPQNRVSLAFDVTTHLEMVRFHDDPVVRETLAQSFVLPSNLGAKLRAIAFAGELPDPKGKEGLVYVVRHDQNPAVRMSALGILTQFEDDSVQMRLIAIDYLGRSPDVLRQAID